MGQGLCTQAQVDDAVQSKIPFGGRLGTNLVELGALSLDVLEESLATLSRTPRAPLAWIEQPDALAKVSRECAERWGALQLSVDVDSAIERGATHGNPFRGPAPAGLDLTLLRALGRSEVHEILVHAISIRNRVVNLLYADAGSAPLTETSAAALSAVAALAARAYQRLVLEPKRNAA